MEDYILQVKNLKTYFYMDNGTLKAVDDVSFNLRRDETSVSLVKAAAEKA